MALAFWSICEYKIYIGFEKKVIINEAEYQYLLKSSAEYDKSKINDQAE